MHVTPVESSTLATVGYDLDGGLLQLEFRSRAVYRYFGVADAVHEALLRATSKGGYFNRAIRGHYRFVRVDPLRRGEGVADPVVGESQRGMAWPAR